MGSLFAIILKAATLRNVIIMVALTVFIAFSARALVNGQEIPESVRSVVYALLLAGVAAGPVEALAARKKEESKGSIPAPERTETELQEAKT